MKKILIIFILPLYVYAQPASNKKLHYKTTVVTDSGVINGYYVSEFDSAITICTQQKYSPANTINIPVTTINQLYLKNRKTNWGGVAVLSVVGFLVTAGLTQKSDIDNDGKTSFFELIYAAIDGSTSGDRRRRRAALTVGAVGGVGGFLLGAFVGKNFSLVFPISNRINFYNEKKSGLNKYVSF